MEAAAASTPFVLTEYVRWGDIDLAGIICYGAYLRFSELAESEVFRAAGLPFSEMFEKYDVWLPRKVMHAEFESPARLDEQLRVVTYFSKLGRTSLTINCDMMDEEARLLHATTHQVLVCVSRRDFVKTPIPEAMRKALSAYAMDSATARAAAARRYSPSASSR
jgi:acyl-CoA thioester hydrolase